MADLYEFDYAALTDDHKQMLESMYQTLMRILAIDHMGCQICALHGLGHLHHPLVPEAVTRYLDTHRSEFDHQDRRWIEECRDGTVL